MTTLEPPGAPFMNEIADPIRDGINRARERLARREIDLSDHSDAVQRAVNLAGTILEEELGDELPPDDAIELFSEHVAIAATMRAENNEPRLTPSEIRTYFVASHWFYNSFWCRRFRD